MAWLAETGVPAEHKSGYDQLLHNIASVDYGESLRHALLHPDPTPQNFIVTHNRDLVPIDWAGAGTGPRVHALAFLLLSAISQSRWNARGSRVDAVIEGYRRHVTLHDEEYAVLAAAMPLRFLVRDCGEYCMGRMTFDEVSGGYSVISRLAVAVAGRFRSS